MKLVALLTLCVLLRLGSTAGEEELGNVFLVLMTDDDVTGNAGTFVLEDNYCLDPVLPTEQSSCRIRVLAPQNSVYSESRIWDMYLDFQHPSRPDTACHVTWPPEGEVRVWCEGVQSGTDEVGRPLPEFREETAASGSVSFYYLLQAEKRCDHRVQSVGYYRDGWDVFPEQRPTVVFRTAVSGCISGIVSGWRANNGRTTEAPCVYNRRRTCRPLTQEQYDSLIRDIEGSETYADFRTPIDRPHLRP